MWKGRVAVNDNTSATGDPGASGIDQILADLEGHAESAWRLRFAGLAAEVDQHLTFAHAAMNDHRVYDASAEWSDLATLIDEAGAAIAAALLRASTLYRLADEQVPHG